MIKVLVVDDHQLIRSGIKRLLEAAGDIHPVALDIGDTHAGKAGHLAGVRSENNGSFDIFQYIYICGERIYAVGIYNHGLCAVLHERRDEFFRMEIESETASYEYSRGFFSLFEQRGYRAGRESSRLV